MKIPTQLRHRLGGLTGPNQISSMRVTSIFALISFPLQTNALYAIIFNTCITFTDPRTVYFHLENCWLVHFATRPSNHVECDQVKQSIERPGQAIPMRPGQAIMLSATRSSSHVILKIVGCNLQSYLRSNL